MRVRAALVQAADRERAVSVLKRCLALMKRGTREKYGGIWDRWLDFIGPKLTRATPLDAAEFIMREKRRGCVSRGVTYPELSRNTLSCYAAFLKVLYDKLTEERIFEGRNPFLAVFADLLSSKEFERRPTEAVPENQVMQLIESPGCSTKIGVRDSCALALLFAGGLRRSELIKLTIGDVVKIKDNYALKLRNTKNGTDALQYLPELAYSFLLKLLEQRTGEFARLSDPLFCDYTKHQVPGARALCASTLYKMFKKYAAALGLPDSISPHSARATAITTLLDSGASHREVCEFSRHGSVAMVERYDKKRANPTAMARRLKYKK